ncbi:hypothetical protein D3C72_2393340 [compost metagenome]
MVSAWVPRSTTFHSEPTFISKRHSKVSAAALLPIVALNPNEAPDAAVMIIFCDSGMVTVKAWPFGFESVMRSL